MTIPAGSSIPAFRKPVHYSLIPYSLPDLPIYKRASARTER